MLFHMKGEVEEKNSIPRPIPEYVKPLSPFSEPSLSQFNPPLIDPEIAKSIYRTQSNTRIIPQSSSYSGFLNKYIPKRFKNNLKYYGDIIIDRFTHDAMAFIETSKTVLKQEGQRIATQYYNKLKNNPAKALEIFDEFKRNVLNTSQRLQNKGKQELLKLATGMRDNATKYVQNRINQELKMLQDKY